MRGFRLMRWSLLLEKPQRPSLLRWGVTIQTFLFLFFFPPQSILWISKSCLAPRRRAQGSEYFGWPTEGLYLLGRFDDHGMVIQPSSGLLLRERMQGSACSRNAQRSEMIPPPHSICFGKRKENRPRSDASPRDPIPLLPHSCICRRCPSQ